MAKRPLTPRSGAGWSDLDYRLYLDGILAGHPVPELARTLGRSPIAINKRALLMLPADREVPLGSAAATLYEILTKDPEYDWEAAVRDRLTEKGQAYWNDTALAELDTMWQTGRPSLTEFAEQHRLTEMQVADRLIRHGHADTITAVVDRLGCTPGGPVAGRYRAAEARTTEALWIATAVTVEGKAHAWAQLLPDHDAAHDALHRILVPARAAGAIAVRWTLAERICGQPATATTVGHGYTLTELITQPAGAATH